MISKPEQSSTNGINLDRSTENVFNSSKSSTCSLQTTVQYDCRNYPIEENTEPEVHGNGTHLSKCESPSKVPAGLVSVAPKSVLNDGINLDSGNNKGHTLDDANVLSSPSKSKSVLTMLASFMKPSKRRKLRKGSSDGGSSGKSTTPDSANLETVSSPKTVVSIKEKSHSDKRVAKDNLDFQNAAKSPESNTIIKSSVDSSEFKMNDLGHSSMVKNNPVFCNDDHYAINDINLAAKNHDFNNRTAKNIDPTKVTQNSSDSTEAVSNICFTAATDSSRAFEKTVDHSGGDDKSYFDSSRRTNNSINSGEAGIIATEVPVPLQCWFEENVEDCLLSDGEPDLYAASPRFAPYRLDIPLEDELICSPILSTPIQPKSTKIYHKPADYHTEKIQSSSKYRKKSRSTHARRTSRSNAKSFVLKQEEFIKRSNNSKKYLINNRQSSPVTPGMMLDNRGRCYKCPLPTSYPRTAGLFASYDDGSESYDDGSEPELYSGYSSTTTSSGRESNYSSHQASLNSLSSVSNLKSLSIHGSCDGSKSADIFRNYFSSINKIIRERSKSMDDIKNYSDSLKSSLSNYSLVRLPAKLKLSPQTKNQKVEAVSYSPNYLTSFNRTMMCD